MICQAQQETCNRDFNATVCHYDDPCVPPCEFEEHGEKIWADVCEEFGMSPYAVPCERDKQRETCCAQNLRFNINPQFLHVYVQVLRPSEVTYCRHNHDPV